MDRVDPWKLKIVRRLRGEATDAERRLWSQLRGSSVWHWRRQRLIHGYVLDFYCFKAALAVEVDGGQHFELTGAKLDQQRDQDLERSGIRVLRYDNATVLEQTRDVAEDIWRICGERGEALNR